MCVDAQGKVNWAILGKMLTAKLLGEVCDACMHGQFPLHEGCMEIVLGVGLQSTPYTIIGSLEVPRCVCTCHALNFLRSEGSIYSLQAKLTSFSTKSLKFQSFPIFCIIIP